MPELIEAPEPVRGTRLVPTARFDLWIVAGLVAATVAVAWFNGKRHSGPAPLLDAAAQVGVGAQRYVVATSTINTQEAMLSAPPLIDVAPQAPQAPVATARRGTAATARPPAQVPAPLVARTGDVPPTRDGVGDQGHTVAQARAAAVAVATAPAVVDRWDALRSAVERCGSASGVIARAMCEQEARLAHCAGFWGVVAACPTARSDYGQ